MSELPAGWARAQIGDLFDTLDDGRTLHQGWSPQCEQGPSESDDDWGVLKTTAIQPAAFLPIHNKRLPAGLVPRPPIEVHPGDILITCAGPRARCGIACLVRSTRPRLMMSGKMYRFRMPERFVSPRYVEYYLQSGEAVAHVDRMKTGGSDSGLNLTHARFRCLPIPLAPRAEQERIVALIEEESSRIDAGVSALEALARRSQQFMNAVYLQLSQCNAPRQRVGDLLSEPLRNGHSAKSSATSQGVRTLTLTAVTQGDFGIHNTKVTVVDPSRVTDLWLRSGDILIERSNTPDLVGTARMYSGPHDYAIFPDLMIRARLNGQMRPRFAELLFQSEPVRGYFRSRAQGISGTMPKIDQQTILDLELPVPNITEQDGLISSADASLMEAERIMRTTTAALQGAQTLRSSLLAAAFSGRLAAQDPDDQPAIALIAGIAADRISSGRVQTKRSRNSPVKATAV